MNNTDKKIRKARLQIYWHMEGTVPKTAININLESKGASKNDYIISGMLALRMPRIKKY